MYGKQEELDKIDQINLDVDVTNVIDDTEVTVSLRSLDSIKDISTSKVKVKIKTEKEDAGEATEENKDKEAEDKEAVDKEEEKVDREAVDKEEKVDNEASVSSKKIEGLPIGINAEDNNQIIDINPKVTDITFVLGKLMTYRI